MLSYRTMLEYVYIKCCDKFPTEGSENVLLYHT